MPGSFAYNPRTLLEGYEFLGRDLSDYREARSYDAGLINSNRRMRN